VWVPPETALAQDHKPGGASSAHLQYRRAETYPPILSANALFFFLERKLTKRKKRLEKMGESALRVNPERKNRGKFLLFHQGGGFRSSWARAFLETMFGGGNR